MDLEEPPEQGRESVKLENPGSAMLHAVSFTNSNNHSRPLATRRSRGEAERGKDSTYREWSVLLPDK